MDVITKIMIHNLCGDLGIVPMLSSAGNINDSLRSLTPDEQREYKRRFRKLWRMKWREARREHEKQSKNRKLPINFAAVDNVYGAGSKVQTPVQRRHRKQVVLDVLLKEVERLKNTINK